MVFRYKDFTLYSQEINWKGKTNKKTIYYFAKKKPDKGIPSDIPEGYEMEISKKTGMPYLKYSEGRISLWQKVKHQR